MKTWFERAVAGFALVTVAAACSSNSGGPQTPTPAPLIGIAAMPVTPADVHFMTGMIPHHAQAIVMGNLAPERAENEGVKVLAARIVVAQGDEIELMRTWLMDHRQPVPPPDATHMRMTMNGVQHDMLMPGMLTAEELAQLRNARGRDFDVLFLRFMIRHHEGALTMVNELFDTDGAAQNETVFRLATDVHADQISEIDRMTKMLEALSQGRTP